jgi:dTDP-glucose 4,6-dehydratase
VRIFNTFGPRMRPNDGRAIPTFVRQALAGEPLTVAGDGSQTRSVCYVDDLVEGLLRLLHSDWPGRSTSATRTSCRCSSWPSASSG